MLTQLKLASLLVAALMMPTGCRSRHHILCTTQGFPGGSSLALAGGSSKLAVAPPPTLSYLGT